jgi:hypothetical protein
VKGRDHVGDPGVNGRPILKRFFKEIWCEDMDCIHLAPDKDK